MCVTRWVLGKMVSGVDLSMFEEGNGEVQRNSCSVLVGVEVYVVLRWCR